jgi:hypothetical protein
MEYSIMLVKANPLCISRGREQRSLGFLIQSSLNLLQYQEFSLFWDIMSRSPMKDPDLHGVMSQTIEVFLNEISLNNKKTLIIAFSSTDFKLKMEAVWFFKILATIITVYGVITQMIAV